MACKEYAFCVPMVPPGANQLRRKYRNRFVYQRLRDNWGWHIKSKHLPKLCGKVEVNICIQHKQFYDPDNLVSAAKVILDSLVNLEILADDTAEHIELHVSQRKGSQKITVISLTGNAMLPAPPRGAVSPSPSAF